MNEFTRLNRRSSARYSELAKMRICEFQHEQRNATRIDVLGSQILNWTVPTFGINAASACSNIGGLTAK
jgi:hypothetical protein